VGKKGQLSVFFIAGIVLIITLSILFLSISSKQGKYFEDTSENMISAGPRQSSLNLYISECVKKTVIDAEREHGLHMVWAAPRIETYIKSYLPFCLNDFKEYRNQRYDITKGTLDVTAQITREALLVEINYPLTFERDDIVINFDRQVYKFPRTVMEELKEGDITRVVSADGSTILEIPPGTKAYLNGEEIFEVGLKLLDRGFGANTNKPMKGMIAFQGEPHGARFTQPIKITHFYREKESPTDQAYLKKTGERIHDERHNNKVQEKTTIETLPREIHF